MPVFVGRCRAEPAARQFRFRGVGSNACKCVSERTKRVRRARSARQRVGMDVDTVRAFPRLQTVSVLSRIFSELFRRETLCDEGRLATYRRLHVTTLVP